MRYKVNCPRCGKQAEAMPFDDQDVCCSTCHHCGGPFWFDVNTCTASIEYPEKKQSAAERIEHLERVLALAKMALEYHTQQTRPIHGTAQTITAIDEALNHQVSG